MTGKKKNSTRPKPKAHDNNLYRKKQQKKAQNSVLSSSAQDELVARQEISDSDRKHQQQVLDVFRHAFDHVLSSPTLSVTLQLVKQALYDRDFARAFGDPEHLEVYAARWSPTRALCYAAVLDGIEEHLQPLFSPCAVDLVQSDNSQSDDSDGPDGPEVGSTLADSKPEPQPLKVFSIGGGAAELVALGAFLNQQPSPLSSSITLLDSGRWETVITKLATALTTPPPLSKYASAAAKLSNEPLVSPSALTHTFLQQDALTLDKTGLTPLLGTSPLLITILFTLNELFTSSGIGKTTALLLNLTAAVPLGSLLLVVDSPGSYSETSVGKEAKRYPMQWLLDRIMLTTRRPPVNGRRWAKVESQDSVWFRLASEGLEYPIPLENMRYQMHLYRAEDAGLDEED